MSGTGLALDIGLFLLLVATGLSPFHANILSAASGVAFVYFASIRHIFEYRGRLVMRLFLAYLLYQAIAVTLASAGVKAIIAWGAAPIVAKVLILPLTFSANYLFMRLLTWFGTSRISAAGRDDDEPQRD